MIPASEYMVRYGNNVVAIPNKEAQRWAEANGIMGGYPNGQFNPGGTATRAQAAQMLKNFMERI